MNEVRALVEAFDRAIHAGERCALATIVSVEGSSYRRPGARMLIRERGDTIGTISAGCLENDVVEHAKRVIRTSAAEVVEYDNSSTSDEMAWGLGLGCNGIVRVLVEPIDSESSYIEALRNSYEMPTGTPHTLAATIYQCIPSSPETPVIATGARLFIRDRDVRFEKLNGSAEAMLAAVRANAIMAASSGECSLDLDGSVAKVFIETLLPPVPLVIFGAGHDALPIVELARELGWRTEVVDPQARPASAGRFAIADNVILARPEDIGSHVAITPRTMTLLMSHNHSHDLALLKFLLESPARYIGVMGPRKRTDRMLNEIEKTGASDLIEEKNLARLHSPVGLDIGANGPAEIALSIVAEMRAVLNGREGGMLRKSRGPIRGYACDDATLKSVDPPAAANGSAAADECKTQGVGAIILAAGASSRMGKPKQALEFEGASLLRRAAQAALGGGCSPVIVVTGAYAELSRRELADLDVREVLNPDWPAGMASSIAAGLDGLLNLDPNAAAAVIMLCDQPYVTADVVSRLVGAHRLTRNTVIASKYGESFGVPALFKQPLFGELARLTGPVGAKEVIRKHAAEAVFLPFPEGVVDVDTPKDFDRVFVKDPFEEIA